MGWAGLDSFLQHYSFPGSFFSFLSSFRFLLLSFFFPVSLCCFLTDGHGFFFSLHGFLFIKVDGFECTDERETKKEVLQEYWLSVSRKAFAAVAIDDGPVK